MKESTFDFLNKYKEKTRDSIGREISKSFTAQQLDIFSVYNAYLAADKGYHSKDYRSNRQTGTTTALIIISAHAYENGKSVLYIANNQSMATNAMSLFEEKADLSMNSNFGRFEVRGAHSLDGCRGHTYDMILLDNIYTPGKSAEIHNDLFFSIYCTKNKWLVLEVQTAEYF